MVFLVWVPQKRRQASTATRSFPNGATVTPGGELTVEIAASDYGSFGASVVETIPGGVRLRKRAICLTGLVADSSWSRADADHCSMPHPHFTYTVTATERYGYVYPSQELSADSNSRCQTDVGGETDVSR